MLTFPLATVRVTATHLGASVSCLACAAASSSSVLPRAASFLPDGYGPEVPQEVVAPLKAADGALGRLWEALKDVGQALVPEFQVSSWSMCGSSSPRGQVRRWRASRIWFLKNFQLSFLEMSR